MFIGKIAIFVDLISNILELKKYGNEYNYYSKFKFYIIVRVVICSWLVLCFMYISTNTVSLSTIILLLLLL
jgi:hypothetical protein